jgi:glycerol-3-phosphate dehydrogenase
VVSGDALRRLSTLHRRGVTGAAVWYDYVTTEADRLTFSFAIAASEHGALLANHLDATALAIDGRRVTGVRAHDAIGGQEVEIAAHVTVNATGAAVDTLLGPAGVPLRIPMLKVMNLVTTRDGGQTALGGQTASGRNLFLVPWKGRALFGTWQAGSLCRPEDGAIVEADIIAFIREINEAFPGLELKANDVAMIHRGIVPAVATNDGVSLEGHEHIHDHAAGGNGLEGLISVVGAKYTTARGVAERVTNRVLAKLQRHPVPCRTALLPLPGGDIRDLGATIAQARGQNRLDLPGDTMSHLVASYGSRYPNILRLCEDRPDLSARLADGSPVIGAELAWAVRHEMAVTLGDAVVRRTRLGALGYPGDIAVDRAVDLVGGALDWSHDRRRAEVSALRRFYSAIFALTKSNVT